MSEYQYRRAESPADSGRLRELFDAVFHPEDVGALAETLFRHFPGMEPKYWFLAEERSSRRLVAGFALIPWTWEIEGARLRVAEMGIVGTLEGHRGKGLMRALNREFDRALADEGFDLAIIQGIPGFYRQFGFYYALPLENHINMPLHLIPDEAGEGSSRFRLAGEADIPWLLRQEEACRRAFSIAAVRDAANWQYLLTHNRQTPCASEFWILEERNLERTAYFRVPEKGFGTGLIVSEISESIDHPSLARVLAFCRQKAVERGKPYIRLNLHADSDPGRMAISMGAVPGNCYAWQVKVPDLARLLRRMAPVLEDRLQRSPCAGYSGVLRLGLHRSAVDLVWQEGRLQTGEASEGMAVHAFAVAADLLPPLLLGHRTWKELRHIRPDVFPHSAMGALLVETLFPACRSWIHQQY
jgi:predicted N-acetyltransferase YhbS